MTRSLSACTLLLAVACGPSYEGQGVKTPDELIEEQEALAAEDEKNKKDTGRDYVGEETDAEKKRGFDRKQSKMELARATRSAESCPGVVAEQEGKDKPRGDTRVT
ncbi:MAG: hypothetical protein FJ104_07530, partial [Deltaproteobacteria bacterium]|nr:hypothetical protein [Deltaproteobacteria bacterium]